MDFGEILKQWDKKAASKGGNKAAAYSYEQKKEDEAGKSLYMGLDRSLTRSLSRSLTRREAEALPIEARLDLHGLTSMEAELALSRFFDKAENMGYRKILIVHGKGIHSSSEPVLEPFVKRWLESRPAAGRTGHPDAANGGKGATWVILKNP